MVRSKPGFELCDGFGHVAAAVAESNVARFVIHISREKKDTGFADDFITEGLDILLWLKTDKADGAGVGRGPFKEVGVAREEGRELA